MYGLKKHREERRGDKGEGRYTMAVSAGRGKFHSLPIPKDSEMEQHVVLIWSTALTAAQACCEIMCYSPLRIVNSVL